jgi:NADPH:quinone reductase-like Zn-dependent oxidoreductase
VGTFAIQLAKHLGATIATTTSAANIDLVKSLGADIIIDYKKEDFETILKDYDVVLNSQDTKTLEKSLKVLKTGGKVISISGPPDPDFGQEINANWFLKIVLKFLSAGIKKKAKRLGVNFSFLFMRAQGEQLSQITKLIELGVIKPVMDKVFPFEQTNEAMSYVETGRAKGKVVVKV